jgi:RNA polymerase sigma-70 factor, ECF subfamily
VSDFESLIEPHRAELHAHCYRMLGSLHDAEDALQETLLRAWRAMPRFEAGRPLRPWLYRIATNVCIDALAERPKRVLPIDHSPPAGAGEGPGRPLAETVWLEPYPDREVGLADGYAGPEARYEQRESVELAFVAAMQHLPPRQRAVLILREVLGFTAREVASALDATDASVNSALQRARRTMEERLPDRSQQETLRALGDRRLRELVESYLEAWEARDVESMVALLVDDATFAMPPHPNWFYGRHAVVAFISGAGTGPIRSIAATANGQPAVAWYLLDEDRGLFAPASLEVLALEGERVKEITAFARPDLFFERFGLPATLPGDFAAKAAR